MINLLKNLTIAILTICFTVACSTNPERVKSQSEQFQGRTQQTIGAATDDANLINKGKWNTTKGKLRDAKEDVKDAVKN